MYNQEVLKFTSLVDDVGEEIIAAHILASPQISVTAVHEGRAEGVDGEGLGDLGHRVLAECPVLLEAHLHHEAVVGEVGDVVARLPDVHLHRQLLRAVALKPPGSGVNVLPCGWAFAPKQLLLHEKSSSQ